jgi:hypothetical protein
MSGDQNRTEQQAIRAHQHKKVILTSTPDCF